jgi:large subunit ribosomal protein L24
MAQGKLKRGEYSAKLRIKKGDEVMVIAGKDKGKTGKIIRAMPKVNKVIVAGINIIVKHQKARQSGRPGAQQVQEGGRIEKPAPMFVPKVMLVCPNCHLPTRVGYQYSEGDSKLSSRKSRVCKHPECGKRID